MTTFFALILLLNGVGPTVVKAVDTTGAAANPLNSDAAPASATPASPTPRKHHHHPKKTTTPPAATSNSPAAPADIANPNAGTSAANSVVSGISDKQGTRGGGDVNFGTQDHTPGTSGTSGQ